jgi:hypothetical protein
LYPDSQGSPKLNLLQTAALEVAEATREMLRERGWAEPIFATSGNGYYLIFQIALPNKGASRELLAKVLKAISFMQDTRQGAHRPDDGRSLPTDPHAWQHQPQGR